MSGSQPSDSRPSGPGAEPGAADAGDALARIVGVRGIGRYTQHVLLCIGPDCAPSEQGLASWAHLKRRLRELGLVGVAGGVYRSKVQCLQVCREGPVAVVYPDGTWYKRATPENLERILQEHVLGGRPVRDLAFARNPLGAGLPAAAAEDGAPETGREAEAGADTGAGA